MCPRANTIEHLIAAQCLPGRDGPLPVALTRPADPSTVAPHVLPLERDRVLLPAGSLAGDKPFYLPQQMMNNQARFCLAVMVLLFFAAPQSHLRSQSAADAIHIMENEIGFGSRAMAMGGAYTAVANDYSAIYWNPAGLASIPGGGIFAEGGRYSLKNDVTYVGKMATVKDHWNHLGSVGLVVALPTVRGSFVLALGFNRIGNYDDHVNFSGFSSTDNGLGFTFIEQETEVFYPFNTHAQRSEIVQSVGGLEQISFGLGVALSPRTTAGLSLSSVGSMEEYRFVFKQTDSEDHYEEYPANFDIYEVTQELSFEGTASQVRAGFLTAFSRDLRFGMSLALPSTFDIAEHHYISEQLHFDDGEVSDTTMAGFWEYNVRTPLILDGGLAFSAHSFTFSSSFRFRDWSRTRFDLNGLQPDSELYQALNSENLILASDYGATVETHVGAEYVLRLKGIALSFRTGYALYPLPAAGENSAESEELMTAGLAISPSQRFIFNFTYLRGAFNRITSDVYTPSGTEEHLTKSTIIINATFRI